MEEARLVSEKNVLTLVVKELGFSCPMTVDEVWLLLHDAHDRMAYQAGKNCTDERQRQMLAGRRKIEDMR